MKLDQPALDYVIAVAKDAGFMLRKYEVMTEYEYRPKITLHLEQSREPKPPEDDQTLFKQQGITHEQAAELAKEAKEKSSRTLDE